MVKDKVTNDLQNNNSVTSKARTWVAILWVENLRPDWENVLERIIQNPFVYCVHDKDVDADGNPRKPHIHLMISFPNTTTYKHAMSIFSCFSVSFDRPCCNTCYRVLNVRYMYNYLIHDTEDARKKKKFQYNPAARICGLNFDIGLLEQLSVADKREMLRELSEYVMKEQICTYLDFYLLVTKNFDMSYVDLIYSYSGHFERLCKACYLKLYNDRVKRGLKTEESLVHTTKDSM